MISEKAYLLLVGARARRNIWPRPVEEIVDSEPVKVQAGVAKPEPVNKGYQYLKNYQ